MIRPDVQALCDEFNIAIVDGRSYPGVRETRCPDTIGKVIDQRGIEHARLMMVTLAETENNQGHIDKYLIWATSDLIEACHSVIEHNSDAWLQCWDRTPVGHIQFIARELHGITRQRDALAGMLYERVFRAFGPLADQPDLFDERRAQ